MFREWAEFLWQTHKLQFPQETRQKPSQQKHKCCVEWFPISAPLSMKIISLKRGESLKSMASLKKGKQCFKRSLCKLQSSENDFTNVLKPNGYHPTTYLDWMALSFQSSAADMSCLYGHVAACTWDTLRSSLPQLSASQFTTTLKLQHQWWGKNSLPKILGLLHQTLVMNQVHENTILGPEPFHGGKRQNQKPRSWLLLQR